jgi:hypothetical protein
MTQRRDLEIDGALALAGGGDFQDVLRAVCGRQPMVLVALAVERRELAFQAPVLAGAVPKLSDGKRGRIEVQVHGAEGALEGDIHSCGLRRGIRSIEVKIRRREVLQS